MLPKPMAEGRPFSRSMARHHRAKSHDCGCAGSTSARSGIRSSRPEPVRPCSRVIAAAEIGNELVDPVFPSSRTTTTPRDHDDGAAVYLAVFGIKEDDGKPCRRTLRRVPEGRRGARSGQASKTLQWSPNKRIAWRIGSRPAYPVSRWYIGR